MTVKAILRDAEELDWAGYSGESSSPTGHNVGPVAQNTGIAAVGPGPGVSPQVLTSQPVAQNAGIAAVGPGPGASPEVASVADGTDIDALASVSELLRVRG